MKMIIDILWVILAYFVGSIPFSYILPSLKGVDVRKVGSGNVGGTNALRSAGLLIGILSMALDILKSFSMVILARVFGFNLFWVYASGVAAVIGHDYPIYMKFKGGKGVASTVGFVFAINPFMGLEVIAIWLLFTLTTKYVSLASMIGLSVLSITAFATGMWYFGIFLTFLTILSIYRHHENIKRLIQKKENKMDLKTLLKLK
jgi:glycerol-3-phosphate acyltransferase PlsY